ncbi:MAG TPA: glycosyltransferase, partial [Candidatus Acetothermia bacterium]|nr:glycosyltransferase [Candidatus Acetothermia bacterium]HEX32310.1 glycosyltransferase [Candidatus Acetothermia bacterium]
EEKLRKAVDEMSLGGSVIFVPSLYKEGLPNVILESMAMGVPVVSSRLAGIPEAVRDGETGVLVSPGDVRELASAIVGLWRDRDTYAQMRDRALYLIRSVFDCKSKLEQYLRFLERMQIEKNVPMEGVTGT